MISIAALHSEFHLAMTTFKTTSCEHLSLHWTYNHGSTKPASAVLLLPQTFLCAEKRQQCNQLQKGMYLETKEIYANLSMHLCANSAH